MKHPLSFMDNAEEWHSFVIGYFEGFCFFIPARMRPTRVLAMVNREYWYYSFGRGLGLLSEMALGGLIWALTAFL